MHCIHLKSGLFIYYFEESYRDEVEDGKVFISKGYINDLNDEVNSILIEANQIDIEWDKN